MIILSLIFCVVFLCGTFVYSYGDQVFLVTSLGNMFLVHEQHPFVKINNTISVTPHFVPKAFDGFYLTGQPRNADAIHFDATYRIPAITSQSPSSVYAAVQGPYTKSTVNNSGPYVYQNGYLKLSTFGLPHILHAIYYKIYDGAPTYHAGSNYVTFGGNGTAAYTLQYVTYNNRAVDKFLVERICYATPCGHITMAKSGNNLLTYTGTLQSAALYDTIQLGNRPAIVDKDHYIISDTSSGGVRLKVAEYDPDTFQIRNMPRGTAYIIQDTASSQIDALPFWPFSYAAPSCCDAPHYTIPVHRAGLQTNHGAAISYDSDSLSEKTGSRHAIQVLTFTDTIWHRGYGANYWLVFDHINDHIIKTRDVSSMFIATPAYAAIPTSTDSALSDISLNKVGCSTKDIPLPYMEGTIQAGQILHIPAIPTHHILCLVDDGASHKIPYNTIQETSHTIPVRPTAHNITSVAPPDIIPCISCAHNTIQTKMGGTAISSAVTISSQDGIMDTSVSGYGTYDSTLTRTWTTTKPSSSVSFWNPEVVVRDGGSAHVSWYRNGMLVHSDKIHCERASYSDDTRRTIQQGMHVIHQWSYKYIHKCNSDIDAYHSIHVKQGDIIQVTLEISPDIAMRMDDHNNAGTSDTTMQHAAIGGIVVKSYR